MNPCLRARIAALLNARSCPRMLPVLLLQSTTASESWGLLRILFVRFDEVSANSATSRALWVGLGLIFCFLKQLCKLAFYPAAYRVLYAVFYNVNVPKCWGRRSVYQRTPLKYHNLLTAQLSVR
jgi:hypothetical protein